MIQEKKAAPAFLTAPYLSKTTQALGKTSPILYSDCPPQKQPLQK